LKDKPIIVFTGGEPALHLHEDEELLKDYFRTCETNGIIELPTWINWITCSPKTIVNNDYISNRVKELKFLMIEEKLDYIEEMYQKFKDIIPIYIQPLELQEKMNIKETIDWLLKHPKACLSLQTHKIIGMK
jgi:organic radical activating enzyme